MKRSFKILIFTLLLALMLLPISASAEEMASDDTSPDYSDSLDASVDNGDADNHVGEGENAPDEDAGGDTAADEINPFSAIYDFVILHIGEIFSILSFIGAAIIALLYKKGLVPVLQKSLGTMASLLGGIREKAEKSESLSLELREEMSKRLGEAEAGLGTVGLSLDKLTERLDSLSLTSDEQDRMREIMKAQIDMLYEIFLCSSLPEYQKEAVRERMLAMKEVLLNEKSNESSN